MNERNKKYGVDAGELEWYIKQLDDAMGELRSFQVGYPMKTPCVEENYGRLGLVRSVLSDILDGRGPEVLLAEDEYCGERFIGLCPRWLRTPYKPSFSIRLGRARRGHSH